ncbi:hypothetical protein GCM10009827_097020 [Dactylosporangium maewongense]|uniref:Uncharacterized protein n=1 Tax=Dactylosporangium maewongense TaxID=634393 RepID=A0ABP4NFZ9_9ACTN
MTVLHTQDGTDFSLVCDCCGLVVDHLGASLHSWTLTWSLFSRHGWIGAQTPGGPHGCPRCVRVAGRSAIDDEESERIQPPDSAGTGQEASDGTRSPAAVAGTPGSVVIVLTR